MTALGVSYLGDRAHHEQFARTLAGTGSSVRWAITPSAGRSMLNSAKCKLGARTRANAVALAMRHGLVR